MTTDQLWLIETDSTSKEDDQSVAQATAEKEESDFPEVIPILPLKDNVLYPEVALPWVVQGEKWVQLVNQVVLGNRLVGVVTPKKSFDPEGPLSPEDFYPVGVVGRISRMLKLPENAVQVLVFGLNKFEILDWVRWEPYPLARIRLIQEEENITDEVEALMRNVVSLFQQVVELAPYLPKEVYIAAINIKKPSRLAHFVVSNLNLEVATKQEILSTFDLVERLKKVTAILTRELEILQIGNKIQSQVQEEMAKTQREYFLREQLKAIQRELGELDEKSAEINQLREQIQKASLPPEVEAEAERELERLSRISPASAEYPVIRNYLDWLIELPWNKSTEDNLDIDQAKQVLDEDHYDLEKVKERILEYLAVCKLRKSIKGPILCFVGPPGVGKTSLGKSIARSLSRSFVRISLGGIRDEAEIRGHRRTYVGALPGRIIQGIRKAGTNNPVFMLDEVDKIGADFRGDPAAALLEVLDPEQNSAFEDHYLGVPFDLSRVMFITTANVLDPIPPALLDRMEIIEIPGYTDAEKVAIAQKYLIPKQVQENGIPPNNISFQKRAIEKIIREYTREAGVRNLERNIATVCRKVAREIAQGKNGSFTIGVKEVEKFLGPRKFIREVISGKDREGVSVGLAWTESGGEILFVETAIFPGKGNLILTGNMGEIMQESARIALSCVRERARDWGISPDFYQKKDIHLHVPAGAIPKDGPSAGVTMVVSMLSALAKIPPRREVAMTGEITLTGRVLPVGGIKEKVLAAYRNGIKEVILPKENEKDLIEIPQEAKKKIKFHLVEEVDQVLSIALRKQPALEKAQS